MISIIISACIGVILGNIVFELAERDMKRWLVVKVKRKNNMTGCYLL